MLRHFHASSKTFEVFNGLVPLQVRNAEDHAHQCGKDLIYRICGLVREEVNTSANNLKLINTNESNQPKSY